MKLIIIVILGVLLSSCAAKNTALTKEQMLALGEAIPVEIVNPRYPRKAAIDRVGGYVRFVFDISPQGAVENLRTIESVPEGVFDSVARYAITRWRFKPAEKNGESVRQTDMAYTMEFKIGE